MIQEDRPFGLGVSVHDYWPWDRGFDSRHFDYFKCELGLERGPPNLVRTTELLLDWEVANLIKMSTLIELTERVLITLSRRTAICQSDAEV